MVVRDTTHIGHDSGTATNDIQAELRAISIGIDIISKHMEEHQILLANIFVVTKSIMCVDIFTNNTHYVPSEILIIQSSLITDISRKAMDLMKRGCIIKIAAYYPSHYYDYASELARFEAKIASAGSDRL